MSKTKEPETVAQAKGEELAEAITSRLAPFAEAANAALAELAIHERAGIDHYAAVGEPFEQAAKAEPGGFAAWCRVNWPDRTRRSIDRYRAIFRGAKKLRRAVDRGKLPDGCSLTQCLAFLSGKKAEQRPGKVTRAMIRPSQTTGPALVQIALLAGWEKADPNELIDLLALLGLGLSQVKRLVGNAAKRLNKAEALAVDYATKRHNKAA